MAASNMISMIQRKTHIVGFHCSKYGSCKPTTFSKKSPPRFFLFSLEFGKFFQNRHKEQLLAKKKLTGGGCRLNGVSLSRCQLLLLGSGKVDEYKVEILFVILGF